MDLYGPLRDSARKYLKAIPSTKGVPTQGEVDDLTRTLLEVRAEALRDAARLVRGLQSVHGLIFREAAADCIEKLAQ